MANIASSNSSNSCMTDEESSQKEELNEEEKIGVLNDFFCNRLLLKRFRKDTRDKAGVPQHVLECERAFNELAQKAVRDTTEGLKLDAMEWVGLCTTFSSKWIDVCHWISPKKLREFFTAHIAAEWVRVEEVPASKEQPPVDLKWYKNPEGCTPVQPCLCPLCNVVCNSLAQYKAHSQGRTHRSLARAYAKKNGGKQVEPVPYSGVQGTDSSADWGDASQTGWEAPEANMGYGNTFMTAGEKQHFPGYPVEEQNYTNYMIWQQQNSVESDLDQQTVYHECERSDASTTLLDSVSPVHIVTAELDEDAKDALSYLNSMLVEVQDGDEDERLYKGIIKCADRIVERAAMHVATALIEAAVNGPCPEVIASITREVSDSHEILRSSIVEACEETVSMGYGECVPAQASSALRSYLNVVYTYYFSTTFNEFVDMKSRHKFRAFVRFCGCLLNEDVLPSSVFQMTIEKLCAGTPSTEDFSGAIQATINTSSSLTIQSKAVVSRLLKKILKNSWYPNRVHNLAATLFVV
eukprot:TRINITY_DN534_c3_g5_i3.p1 TRINITY_DN534_c3_g5~~TRINITY_DN534_c3_g5_i3.p1  ORF type:complete len:538 (+),score=165.45 TRINITY_DN534_c3_g5_i3:47-1615(+)